MAEINTYFLCKSVTVLENSYKLLKSSKKDSIEYEISKNYLVLYP